MKKYISITLIALVVAVSSCKKTYLSELAVNPNTPAQTTPDLALTGALKTTAAIVNSATYMPYGAWMGWFSQSTGVQPTLSLLAYSITSSTYDMWTSPYINISNYTAMEQATTNTNYISIGKIMVSFMFENLVDNYNNVPYFNAIKGISNLTPSYDSGSAVYD